MKWIKATERLPEYDDVIHVKIDGVRKMGNFYENEYGSTWFYTMATSSGNDWHVPPHKLSGIEWLCESEQDEGWVPAETPPPTNEKFNESDYYLCLHKWGEQVVCWYNSNDKAWRVGNYKADSLPLTGVTHYRKLPAPPATKD